MLLVAGSLCNAGCSAWDRGFLFFNSYRNGDAAGGAAEDRRSLNPNHDSVCRELPALSPLPSYGNGSASENVTVEAANGDPAEPGLF